MTRADVLRALEGCRVISYPTLLARLLALGIQPRALALTLDAMERDGLVLQTTRQGRRWRGRGRDRGPLYVHVL